MIKLISENVKDVEREELISKEPQKQLQLGHRVKVPMGLHPGRQEQVPKGHQK